MWVDRSPGWFNRRRESQENKRWKIKELFRWGGRVRPHLPFSHLPSPGGVVGAAGSPSPISHAPILPSPGGVRPGRVAFPVEGWFDGGTLEALLETNRHLLEGVAGVGNGRCQGVGEDSVVIPPVYVASTARVRHSVIGPYVSVREGAQVERVMARNMIIGNQAAVEDVLLEDTLIGYQAVVKGRAGRLNVGDRSEVMG